MMLKTIIGYKNDLFQYYQSVSLKTRKEVQRFILAFLLAWFLKTLLNEFPVFSQIFLITHLDSITQAALIQLTQSILEFFGYQVYSQGIFIQIAGTVGIRYELSCLAFRHISLFIIFILAYYGSWKHKLWYIPLGIIILFTINAFRGAFVCIAQVHTPENSIKIHDIISPVLMYLSILALWIVWVSKYGTYKNV